MKSKKKLLRISGLAFLSVVFLAGCGEKAPEPVEITLIHGWGTTEEDHVVMRDIYQDFEKENPDVKLNQLSMPSGSEMVRKVEDMLVVGEIPVSVMETAGEGGAWGIALLASYLINKEEGETLPDFLDSRVFAGNEGSTLDPKPEGVEGFNIFMERYMKGLNIEKAAVESEIW